MLTHRVTAFASYVGEWQGGERMGDPHRVRVTCDGPGSKFPKSIPLRTQRGFFPKISGGSQVAVWRYHMLGVTSRSPVRKTKHWGWFPVTLARGASELVLRG